MARQQQVKKPRPKPQQPIDTRTPGGRVLPY